MNVRDAAWSPDGMRIAFGATSRPLLSFGGTSDIYFVDLAHGNAVHKVVALDGPDTSPRFSPDGTRLAFGTSLAQPYFFYANDHIASVNVEDVLKKPATKPEDVVDLTPKFDENAYLLDWTKAGILFRAQQRVHSALFRLDPATASIARVTPETCFSETPASRGTARSSRSRRPTRRAFRRSSSQGRRRTASHRRSSRT